jgi:hypothetical protein
MIGTIAVVYFVVGSLLFPDWFYGLLWDFKFWHLTYWLDGVWYWIDFHTDLLAMGVVVIFGVVTVVHKYRTQFWSFVDRTAYWIIFGSASAILVTSLLVYKYAEPRYESWLVVQSKLSELDGALRQLASLGAPPTIEEPIDFQYLDKPRVQALFNQLEPELVEEERTVSAGGTLAAKAGVKAGSVGGEVEATKKQEATSTYNRLNFSAERQCSEVMKFVLKHEQAQYYTDGGTWFLRKTVKTMWDQYEASIQSPQTREVTMGDIGKLRLELVWRQAPTKEEQEETQLRVKQYEQEFDTELTTLEGLVFVQGEFKITHSQQGSLLLAENFADSPRHVVFRVNVPLTPEMSSVGAMNKTRLRVFGTILRPLDDDGVIEVRPIAIY